MIASYSKVALSKVIKKLESGSRPKGGIVDGQKGVFSLGGEHLNDYGGFRFENKRFVSEEFYLGMKRGKLKPEDILVVKDGATTGKVSFVDSQFPHFPACINEHLFRLEINKSIADPKYIFFYLFSSAGNREVMSDFRGATVGGISQEFVEKVFVPLPPLDEQQRLAAILSKADRLRRLRRYTRTLSDGYLQSVFLEMFGDPVSNPRGWEIVSLGSQLRHIDSGWSPVCDDEPRTNNNQWAILRLSAVTTGKYLSDENKSFPLHLDPRPELEVKKGDVLITRKNTIDLVAACAFVHETPPKFMLPDTIFRFSLKETREIEPEYLWGLFSEKLFRKSVQTLASGTAGSMPNISKEKFLNVNLPLPPLPLQQKFARIVQKYERLRAQQRESERQAEHLFQSLLHRAFRGEV